MGGHREPLIKVGSLIAAKCPVWFVLGDHSFSMYAKFSKKPTFLTPLYEHVNMRQCVHVLIHCINVLNYCTEFVQR